MTIANVLKGKISVALLVFFVVCMALLFTVGPLIDNGFITALLMVFVFIPVGEWTAKKITGVDIMETFFP